MKRREFIKGSLGTGLALSALPAIGNLGMQALATSPGLDTLHRISANSDRVLVVVQLSGGNDGLNTLVPFQDQLYYDGRPAIALDEQSTLPLNDSLRWHGAMGGMRSLYEDEKMAVVQGVAYPNPNRSHFRGTDIWLSASDADKFISSGWMGRYLEGLFPYYPETLPEDPIAIQIGGSPSLGFQSRNGGMAISFRDPEEFYQLVGQREGNPYPDPPDTPFGHELDYVRTIAEASRLYSERVYDASQNGNNAVSYPETRLAQSLKVVAELIAGGLQTKFYLVSIGGFDTHANQPDAHTALLRETSDAIKAFVDDIEALGHGERVAGITFSEFGRRVAENGSIGTDHGTAAPLFVFGSKVLGRTLHGADPKLAPEFLDNRGDIIGEFDFRQVYASVLIQWFGESRSRTQELLYHDFTTLPLFENLQTSVRPHTDVQDPFAIRLYPTPADAHATVEFTLAAPAHTAVAILDIHGRLVQHVGGTERGAGTHRVPLRLRALPPGMYFCRVEAAGLHSIAKLGIVR